MPRAGRGRGGVRGSSRRKPLSGKQKKEYLKRKKAEKEERKELEVENFDEAFRALRVNPGEEDSSETNDTRKSVAQPAVRVTRAGANNFLTSLFAREDDEAVQARRDDAARPLDTAKRLRPLRAFESINVDFPKRPVWDASTTPEELEDRERGIFEAWLRDIHAKYSLRELAPFEHNLEVWRQLWRTIEKSDVILVVVDVRNPLLHFPRMLYDHIVSDHHKPVVVCLTKVDLVPDSHLEIWMEWLKKHLADFLVVTFSTKVEGVKDFGTNFRGGWLKRRRRILKKATQRDQQIVHENSRRVLHACLTTISGAQHRKLPVVGVVGHPNCGKSSLVNALIGEKVVSVSRQAGHTKHWQTFFLYKGNEAVAQLCDSPGIVFPVAWKNDSAAPRHVFECCGLYPIPQIRETFSAIRFIAEHIPLEEVYNLELDTDDFGDLWSPYAICGTFANKHGYTIEGGGPDFHRAGLEILRDTVDGLVLLAFSPPEMENNT